MRRAPAVILSIAAASLLAACGLAQVDLSHATSYWRQQVARHYHGAVATGDGRGCAQVAKERFSCTAYVRIGNSGIDVIGTVTSDSITTTVDAHQATGAEIRAWRAEHPSS